MRWNQLRLMDAGIQVGTFLVEVVSLSVTTAEQLGQACTIAIATLKF